MMMGKNNANKSSISYEMAKIAEFQRQRMLKERLYRKKKCNPFSKPKDGTQILRPIEWLKNSEFLKTVTTPFKTQTRDQWTKARAQRSCAPDVGHYHPNTKESTRSIVFTPQHTHIGAIRIFEKELQQGKVCRKQISNLNNLNAKQRRNVNALVG